MNLYELFKKFETEFLAGHEKIKTELDFELFVGVKMVIRIKNSPNCKGYVLVICRM